MKRLGKILSVLLALTLLGVLGAGAYFAIEVVTNLFMGLDAQAQAVIVAALVAVLVGAVVVALVVQWAQKPARLNRQRVQKAGVYQHFLDAWSAVLRMQGRPNAPEFAKTAAHLRAAERDLLLWGSRGVVRRYMAYRKQARGNDPHASASLVVPVLQEIRRDLGRRRLGLESNQLLDLFLGEIQATPEAEAAPEVETVHGAQAIYDGNHTPIRASVRLPA